MKEIGPPRETRFSRRALLLGGGMGLVGTTLAGRLAWLSLFEGERLAAAAERNRIRNRLVPPRRGWIIDRSGAPLAVNRPDYRLELLPREMEDLDATLARIGEVLPLGADELARIRADVADQPDWMPVEVAKGLDWPAFAALNVRVADVPGVHPVRVFSRHYPGGEPFAHLLGYVGPPSPEQYEKERDPLLVYPGFRIGKDGVERHEDRRLRGRAGARREEVTARGRVIRELELTPDEPGETLRLTIDRDLQAYAARRLEDNSASAVVIDCLTGELLTMISMPAFDPNVFSTRVSTKLWQALQDDNHTPLLNKSAMGVYPPGSTFKMVTALAALDAGIAPEASVNCTGRYPMGSNVWHCHARRGHGRVTMETALPKSCDTWFYEFGREVGIERIAEMARRLGLGEEFPLPLPGQATGLVPDNDWKMRRYNQPWNVAETLNCSIGQGYLIANPLQLAVMTARIASGRKVMPKLLLDDAPAAPFAALGIEDAHLEVVRKGMRDVVNASIGTAPRARAQVPGLVVCGKTGTAQVRRISSAERRTGVLRNEALPWEYRDHALFVAYAPADTPRYAVSVIIEHGISGGRYAAPIARDLLTFLHDRDRAMASLEQIEAASARRKAAVAQAEASAGTMMPAILPGVAQTPAASVQTGAAPQAPREVE
ncbi:MAG: penicillin-binding protein 2 [Polymorphobacter sp.]|uniref:penicillin-binding protein 2 n=1 Tax=Polymorphobacter sp. TaxID=1909290 RepID=UPI003A890E67